ncbi:MAG: SdrD B-like domain-containing protein [Pseudomonadota bacterium]
MKQPQAGIFAQHALKLGLSALLAAGSASAFASDDGAIGGRAWHDVNRNGLQDDHEPACPGVKIRLDAKKNPKAWYHAITDDHGNYEFLDLPFNKYIVNFEKLPGGFTKPNKGNDDTIDSDAKSNGSVKPFTLKAADPTRFDIDAGYKQGCPEICVPIDFHPQNDEVQIELGEAINLDLLANDGVSGVVMITSGELPAGTSLSDDGVLTGTPKNKGTFEFTYKVNPNDCSEGEAKVTIVVKETIKPDACLAAQGAKSINSHNPVWFKIMNMSSRTLKIYWLDYHGNRQRYHTIEPGETVSQDTYKTHPWLAVDAHTGKCVDFIHQARNHFVWQIKDDSACDTCKAKPWSKSQNAHVRAKLKVENAGDRSLKLFWIDYHGNHVFAKWLEPGDTAKYWSYKTHPWVVKDEHHNCVDFIHQPPANGKWRVQ